MAKVFDKLIDVKKKDDGSFTVSVATSDKSLVIVVGSRKDLEQHFIELEKLLKED